MQESNISTATNSPPRLVKVLPTADDGMDYDSNEQFVSQFCEMRFETDLVPTAFVNEILEKALSSLNDAHIAATESSSSSPPSVSNTLRPKEKAILPLTISDISISLRRQRLIHVKDILYTALKDKEGTQVWKMHVDNLAAYGIPALTFSQYFVNDSPSLAMLYSTVMFTGATMFSRYFYHRGESIGKSITHFKKQYADLGQFIRELFGLGFFRQEGNGLELGPEIKTVGHIVLSTWVDFMVKNALDDLYVLNKFRMVDTSLSMFITLSRYLKMQREVAIKSKILEIAGSAGFTHDPK
ncbi:MAG: hypothetical protein ACHP6I_02460, partial [Rickettsiales bacterium]